MRNPTDNLNPEDLPANAQERSQYAHEFAYYLSQLKKSGVEDSRARHLAASMATKAVRREPLSTSETNALCGLDDFNETDYDDL